VSVFEQMKGALQKEIDGVDELIHSSKL
jgi:hypothetical protein